MARSSRAAGPHVLMDLGHRATTVKFLIRDRAGQFTSSFDAGFTAEASGSWPVRRRLRRRTRSAKGSSAPCAGNSSGPPSGRLGTRWPPAGEHCLVLRADGDQVGRSREEGREEPLRAG
jgi:hypothetical protein